MRKLTRRSFSTLLATGSVVGASRELAADVVIIGASTGGCAAALGALRNGMRVILTEECDWIGGQLTSQLVPPDEHPWIESFGCTRLYRTFRVGVREYYRRFYPLTEEARSDPLFNPGEGAVSGLTHEPRVALAVLRDMLAPYQSSGRLTLLTEHRPVAADVDGDRIKSVTVRDELHGRDRTLTGTIFLDATDRGDLLPLTRTEFVTGFESRRDTGEPHAPEQAQPENVQAFTVCFAMDYLADQDHTIDKPAEYTFWRDYVPKLKPPWPGKLLEWAMCHPHTLARRVLSFDPTVEEPEAEEPLNLWRYRRIARRKHFRPGAFPSDLSLVNWPLNDYWLGRVEGGSEEQAAHHLRRAKQLSLSLLYWMQTEAPRPRGGYGWKGLRLRADIAGTDDGLAKAPYLRESRRIQAEFTVVEKHIGTEARVGENWRERSRNELIIAEPFFDSVGVGSYRIDLHPSTGGDNYVDISSLPFQIPLGALIPKRVENLIAACKNLGVTHITNGCFRLHPVEWNIGESAGTLAAFAVQNKTVPRAVRSDKQVLRQFQRLLTRQGVEIAWPRLDPR